MTAGPFDISLESLRFNGKDLIVIIGLAWGAFQVYGRFDVLEAGIIANRMAAEVGVLEVRIAGLNMELAYMESHERDETDQRIYDLKKGLLQKLISDLEDMQ